MNAIRSIWLGGLLVVFSFCAFQYAEPFLGFGSSKTSTPSTSSTTSSTSSGSFLSRFRTPKTPQQQAEEARKKQEATQLQAQLRQVETQVSYLKDMHSALASDINQGRKVDSIRSSIQKLTPTNVMSVGPQVIRDINALINRLPAGPRPKPTPPGAPQLATFFQNSDKAVDEITRELYALLNQVMSYLVPTFSFMQKEQAAIARYEQQLAPPPMAPGMGEPYMVPGYTGVGQIGVPGVGVSAPGVSSVPGAFEEEEEEEF